MIYRAPWILLHTETTSFATTIFAVDLAAQKMCGWERDGQPLRRMLSHGCEIPAERSEERRVGKEC